MKRVYILLMIITCIPLTLMCSINFKLLGTTKEQNKRVLIFSPWNSLFGATPASNDFDFYLDKLGIKIAKKMQNGPFNNNGVTVYDLVKYLSFEDKNKYSIIYIFTHGSPDSLLIESYKTRGERNDRLIELNNDPKFTDKNYFKEGLA